MAVVPAALAQPLVLPPRPSGGARRQKLGALPQTFLVISLLHDQCRVHGLCTFNAVGTFGADSTTEEHRQLASLKLDPGAAVIWNICATTRIQLASPLVPDVHCSNLCRLNIAHLTQAGKALLVSSAALPCSVSKIRVLRLPRRAADFGEGMQTLVTPATYCRAAGVPKPSEKLAGREAAALAVAGLPGPAKLELAENTECMKRGFSTFQFKAPAIFLALRLQHKLRTQGKLLPTYVMNLSFQLVSVHMCQAANICAKQQTYVPSIHWWPKQQTYVPGVLQLPCRRSSLWASTWLSQLLQLQKLPRQLLLAQCSSLQDQPS